MVDFAYAIVCKLGLADVDAVRELAARDGRDWLWPGEADTAVHRRAALATVRGVLEDLGTTVESKTRKVVQGPSHKK